MTVLESATKWTTIKISSILRWWKSCETLTPMKKRSTTFWVKPTSLLRMGMKVLSREFPSTSGGKSSPTKTLSKFFSRKISPKSPTCLWPWTNCSTSILLRSWKTFCRTSKEKLTKNLKFFRRNFSFTCPATTIWTFPCQWNKSWRLISCWSFQFTTPWTLSFLSRFLLILCLLWRFNISPSTTLSNLI